MSWSPQDVEELTALCREPLTFKQIAVRMGRSTDSVIRKAVRLDIKKFDMRIFNSGHPNNLRKRRRSPFISEAVSTEDTAEFVRDFG